jgi:hypothetical protein
MLLLQKSVNKKVFITGSLFWIQVDKVIFISVVTEANIFVGRIYRRSCIFNKLYLFNQLYKKGENKSL